MIPIASARVYTYDIRRKCYFIYLFGEGKVVLKFGCTFFFPGYIYICIYLWLRILGRFEMGYRGSWMTMGIVYRVYM